MLPGSINRQFLNRIVLVEWLGVISFGGAIVAFGGLFLRRHWVVINRLKKDRSLTEQQASPLLKQQRRRMLTSGLVVLVGLLIPLCYDLTIRLQNPKLAAISILLILALVLNIVLLALFDLVSSSSLKADLTLRKAQVDLQKALLEKELEEYQSGSPKQTGSDPRSNGSAP